MLPFIFIYIPYFPDFPFSQMNDSVPNMTDSVMFFFKAEIQWTLSMDSVDSLDIVHGHPGQSPGSPGGQDNVHGQSPLSPWTDWTLSMDFVQSDLVKQIEVKVASLEIYIHICF